MQSIVKKLACLRLVRGVSMPNPQGEPKTTSDFKLGQGLAFSLNDGA